MQISRFELKNHGINEVEMPAGARLLTAKIDPNGCIQVIALINPNIIMVRRKILMTFENVALPLGFSESKYLASFDIPTVIERQPAVIHVHCLDGGETGLLLTH